MPEFPVVHVVVGPNRAGKTAFARRVLPRFARCEEFVNTYPFAFLDRWIAFDNSGEQPTMIVTEEKGTLKIVEPNLFAAIKKHFDTCANP